MTSQGLYLYGVVRAEGDDRSSSRSQTDASLVLPNADPMELIRVGRVAAVVRRVPLRDFAPEALERRFRDKVWLERTVRSHNAVVEALHARRALLPAKFGAVYAKAEDVAAALRSEEANLLAALDRIDGRDEWIVHLQVDEERLARAAQTVRSDASERRPGHAYFERRRAERERDLAMDGARADLAAAGYDAIARRADEGRVMPSPSASGSDGGTEVLRAAFLVRREGADDFIESMRAFAAEQRGIRWEYSGPLPPYSFASAHEEAA